MTTPSRERRLIDGVWQYVTAEEGGAGSLPSGGSTGEVLTKASNADGDADWEPGGGSVPVSSPLDIDDCVLWLDASTLALADDAPVATWPDLSPSGFDATQADPDLQPVCKTAVLNGLRVVRFTTTAGNPPLTYLGLSGAGLNLVRNRDAITVACVVANPTTPSTFYALTASANGNPTFARLTAQPHGDGIAAIGGNNDDSGTDSDYAEAGDMASPTPPLAAVGTVNYSGGYVLMDTSVPSTSNGPDFNDTPGPTPDSPSDAILIGAFPDVSGGSDCDYGEIIVYNRALNAKERRELLEYLSVKWATP